MAAVVCVAACSAPPRDGWLADGAMRSDGLCWWRDARWEDRGVLLVRGTGQRFARAKPVWEEKRWRGALTTGVLTTGVVRAGPAVLFQGTWQGGGLTLQAEVDVGRDAVFRAYQPMRVGAAGLLLRGAPLRITDAMSGRALALPAATAFDHFAPEDPMALELGCEGLSLYAPVTSGSDAAREALTRAGFPANAPEVWLPAGQRVAATGAADGTLVGHFVTDALPARAYAVKQEGANTRLALTADHLLWVGWVPTEALVTASRGPAPAESPARVAATAPKGRVVTCADELPLFVSVEGQDLQVGLLAAGTPLGVEVRGERVIARPHVPWLELEPDVELTTVERALRCRAGPELLW